MAQVKCPQTAQESLELYFLENRARLLEIAAFLDRLDRYDGAAEAKVDFRYQAFVKALHLLFAAEGPRTRAIQLLLSDQSSEPIMSAVGLKALGAWKGEDQ